MRMDWQPRQDSNLNKQNQNLLCYRYTTELYGGHLYVDFEANQVAFKIKFPRSMGHLPSNQAPVPEVFPVPACLRSRTDPDQDRAQRGLRQQGEKS